MVFFSPFRKLLRFIVRCYYRRVQIEGFELLEQQAPALFCANHPNSLFDPILVGIAVKRPVHFLAKAPLFQIPVLGAILHGFGMIPAYRAKDNAREVGRNQASLESAAKILLNNEAVGIFPEGLTHDRLGLAPVRSGAARIALAARQQGRQHLQIVPIGLNYEDKARFRSDVWIQIGSPINLDQWCQTQEGTEKQLQRQFSNELQLRLNRCVIHLDDADWERWLNAVEVMLDDAPIGSDDGFAFAVSPLGRRREIARLMNQFLKTNMEHGTKLGNEIGELEASLGQRNIEFAEFARNVTAKKSAGATIRQALLLIILFPIAVLGTAHHIVPFLITRALSTRFQSRVKRTDVSLYRLMFSLPIYALAYAAIGILLTWSINLTTALVWLLVAPLAGILAFEYWPAVNRFFKSLRQRARISSLRRSSSEFEKEYRRLAAALNEVAKTEAGNKS